MQCPLYPGTDPEDVIRNAFACFDEEGTGKIHEDRWVVQHTYVHVYLLGQEAPSVIITGTCFGVYACVSFSVLVHVYVFVLVVSLTVFFVYPSHETNISAFSYYLQSARAVDNYGGSVY